MDNPVSTKTEDKVTDIVSRLENLSNDLGRLRDKLREIMDAVEELEAASDDAAEAIAVAIDRLSELV